MRDEQLQRELDDEFAQALKALTEAVVNQTLAEHQQRRAKQTGTPFPFSPLEWLITQSLVRLERLVRRVVSAVIR